jgi:acetoin utilization deacetylase AcuC-like enzyme
MQSVAADRPVALPVAVVDDTRFEAHEDTGGQHPECPERLVAARSGLFGQLAADKRLIVPAREASADELTRVHSKRYVEELAFRLTGGSGHLDPDTYFCPQTREAAWLAAGGSIDLVHALLRGDARTGFALLRPPGHHAVPSRSMGFCLLNNVALAARAALDSGLSRVAIVDWDVHHGNGTQDAFYDDPRVLFVSLHQFPFYPGTGASNHVGRDAGAGYTANLALPAGGDAAVYGAAFREVIVPLLRAHAPELILVSAGFDAHARDPLASMELESQTYAALASSLLQTADALGHGRVGFVLEGGYDLLALEESVAWVTRATLGEHMDLPEGGISAGARRAIDATKAALAAHWPSVTQLTAATS